MNFTDLPEINFDNLSVEELFATSKNFIEQTLGRTLARGDPLNLFLKSLIAIIIQQRELINQLARQNLLAYASGDNLDHFGIFVGCERLQAQNATCTVEIELSSPREKTTIIPKGTRITPGDEIYFALDDDVIFLIGETLKTAKATCTTSGEIGNNYAVGEIQRIVDPQPFLKSIKNITKTEGGADLETDDSYRERIRITPESYSVAGPSAAYEYFTKAVSTLIIDVYVHSPSPGVVNIFPLMENGNLPDSEMLEKIFDYINNKTRRPLTDYVEVLQPVTKYYNIDCRYFINRTDASHSAEILHKAEKAVEDYILWQKNKLGRDINPTELNFKLRQAGVKRVEILEPVFTKTAGNVVAIANNISAIYAGLEDD